MLSSVGEEPILSVGDITASGRRGSFDVSRVEFLHIYVFMVPVKTTLEIPEPLFRQLKISAAKQGKTIRAVVNEALTEKLNRSQHGVEDIPAWRVAFGGLRRLRDETAKISQNIATEFSRVNPEEWK
jgi:hypothetical protein